ncbi:MAG TPA: hypothetical protein VJ997_14065 [Longimicrobiales bacterium]|nr:hypothetical protein [Longimicrobiales bacterium]
MPSAAPPHLTAEELLAGAEVTHLVEIPARLLDAGTAEGGNGAATAPRTVELRALTIRDVQRITRAAREEDVLSSQLIVQQALVTPRLTWEQVGALPAGVVQHLLARVNHISGLTADEDSIEEAVKAPLARACFVLAREFGWTPAQCSELTVGQVLLYLDMIARGEGLPPTDMDA